MVIHTYIRKNILIENYVRLKNYDKQLISSHILILIIYYHNVIKNIITSAVFKGGIKGIVSPS